MKKKEEVTITFYAAECGEFHDLGEYTRQGRLGTCAILQRTSTGK